MIITNKDVIQSYILTAARYDWSVHEKRILFRLVEMCQQQLEGKKLNAGFAMDRTLFGDYVVTMPVSAFLKDEVDHNHAVVKKALRSLRDKTIEYENAETWKLIGIIEKPKFEKRGFVNFEVQPEIYDVILNFSKGFRRFELKTAMSFDSSYAMRFYELLSGKYEPITYNVEDLKIMFGVEKKYKQTGDFIKRVVEPAKKEMDKKAPFSFNYKTILEYGGKKIISIKFHPYKIAENRDETLENKELQQQLSLRWSIDKIYVNYLKQNYLFTNTEIKNNIETFKEALEKIDLLGFLAKKKRDASMKKSPKGWIIGAIKKEMAKTT